MVDEERLPSGDDLISEIEQFLRDRGKAAVEEAVRPVRRPDRLRPTRGELG